MKKSDTLHGLVAVRTLLADRKSWTKGVAARGAAGQPVHWDSNEATCFCLWGASVAVCGASWSLSADLCQAMCKFGLTPDFNDSSDTSHPKLIRKLDAAIAELEAAL